ncbi:MAG: C25 family cysteine peptidase [Sumerlaeia bacterium]
MVFPRSLPLILAAVWHALSIVPGFAQAAPLPPGGLLSPSRPALLLPVTEVRSHPDRVAFSLTVPASERNEKSVAALFATPPGSVTLHVESVTLAHFRTANRVTLTDREKLRPLLEQPRFKQAVNAKVLGDLRGVQLTRLLLDPRAHFVHESDRYELIALEAELRFQTWEPRELADSALTDPASPMRLLLDKAVVNPEAIPAYARNTAAAPAKDFPQAATWQPLPGESAAEFPWRKIPVAANDLYIIDGRWLSQEGLDPAAVAPERLRLVSRGESVELFRLGGETFSRGARLVFAGQGSDSEHTTERMYWLGMAPDEATTAALIAERPEPPADTGAYLPVQTTRRRLVVEEDLEMKTRVGNFLSIRELTWVWRQLPWQTRESFEFYAPGLAFPAPPATGQIDFYFAGTGLRRVVRLDGYLNGEKVISAANVHPRIDTLEFNIPAGVLKNDRNVLELEILDKESGNQPSPVYLNRFALRYESLIKATAGRMALNFEDDTATSGPVMLEAIGFRRGRMLALDLTDPSRPELLPSVPERSQTHVYADVTSRTRLLLVEDDSLTRAPQSRPSDWAAVREENQSADVLLIAHNEFREAAERLAADLRSAGRETRLVDVASLYDAYSHGEVSPAAIRLYIRDAVTRWTGRRPAAAILIGDCTSDGRNRSRTGVRNYLPTISLSKGSRENLDTFASDHVYAQVMGEDELGDLLIGRLSVATPEDAATVVDKIVAYRRLSHEDWAGAFLSLADGEEFQETAEIVAEKAMSPRLFHRHISLAEMQWEENYYLLPQYISGLEARVSSHATDLLEAAVEEGLGMVTFYGHGSPNIWSNQRIWFGGDSANSDNLRLDNGSKLPYFVSYTCNNGAIDYPLPRWNVNIAEDAMRVQGGGFIGCWVPSGPGFSYRHRYISQGLNQAISHLDVRNVAVAAELGRLSYQATLGPDDHSQMYIFLGDPTLELPMPEMPEEGLRAQILRTTPRVLKLELYGAEWKEAVGTLRTETGVLIGTTRLHPAGPRAMQGEIALPMDVPGGVLNATVQAKNADGIPHQFGQIFPVEAPDIVVTDLRRATDRPTTAPLQRIEALIENRGRFEAESEIILSRWTADGPVRLTNERIRLSPGEFLVWGWEAELPPGAHVYQAELTPARSENNRAGFPTADAYAALVTGEADAEQARFAVPAQPFLFRPSQEGSQMTLEFHLANTGSADDYATLNYAVEGPGVTSFDGKKSIGHMPAQSGAYALVVPRIEERVWSEGARMRLSASPTNDALAIAPTGRLTAEISPIDLPDLRFRPESVKLQTPAVGQGQTVLVEGIVENAGGGIAPATEVQLYPGSEMKGPGTRKLFSAITHPGAAIPPLQPGESYKFRARWDPDKDLGKQSFHVVVGENRNVVERDWENNSAPLTVEIRKLWELSPLPLRFAKGSEPGTALLLAEVANTGETDAELVVVEFYGDKETTAENSLGTVTIPIVPAGQQRLAQFEWDLRGLDPSIPREPSYSVGLRGSMRRYAPK